MPPQPPPPQPLPIDHLLTDQLPALRAFVQQQLGAGLRQRESCGDIVQSVCRDVLLDAAELEFVDPGAFAGYLRRRARHKILHKHEHHRAQRRDLGREEAPGQHSSGADPLERLARDSGTPSRAVIRAEEQARVQAALDELPARYREAVRRNRLEGERAVDIAASTGQSDGAVRNQVYRGLAQLAQRLMAD